jgi:hypothetical protein
LSKLFVSRPGSGNVVLNFCDSREEFHIFALAYHSAAQRLVTEMKGSTGYPDYDAYPILFLYRHALELYLKAIVLKGAALLRLLEDRTIDYSKFFTRHELTSLLPAIQIIWKLVGWDWDFRIDQVKTFEDFRDMVQDLEEIDPSSFSFRYPLDKRFQAVLPHHFCFSLFAFAEQMDPVLETLGGAVTGLEERWDYAAEIIYEAERILRDTLK